MRIGVEACLEVARHQVEPSGPEVGMVDGGQRVEDRAVQRLPQVAGDVCRGLFRNLADDDLGLETELGDRQMLQVEHERGRANRRDDGEDQWMRAPGVTS
jgi:hypothetical protein